MIELCIGAFISIAIVSFPYILFWILDVIYEWRGKKVKYESYEEELLAKVEQKDKEIERLNENNQAYQEELCKVWEERDNAYRIINELLIWLEEQAEKNDNSTIVSKSYKLALYNIVDKIKELKGSDKE